MRFNEYGSEKAPCVLLIHGMGCTAEKSFAAVRSALSGSFYVIMVSLDGYDESGSEFTSISGQAKKIAAYLREKQGGRLSAVLGMSMGGFIALELLCREGIRADKLILDSGYMNNMAFPRAVAKTVAWGFGRVIDGRDGALLRAGMKHMMGFCFRRDDLCRTASRKTIENSEYTCLSYKLPEIAKPLEQTEVVYWYGERERYMIKGMKTLKARLPALREVCLGDVGHGELMFTAPEIYAKLVLEELNKPVQ